MSSISNRNMMSGLISGLDTEQLVKAMTMNTKNRINSQKQKLQTLQWKQESYRDVISKITDFKEKYLKIDAENSIKANRVMKKYVAESSNDKVITATASSNAVNAKYTIKQAHAAKAAELSSNGAISTREIKLDFSNTVSGKDYKIEMTLDGITKNVTFRGGANEEDSKKNFAAAANASFSDVMGEGKKFEFRDGTNFISFNGNNDEVFHTFSIGYNSEAIGLANTAYNRINTNSTIGSIGFNQELMNTSDGKYVFNINGVDFEFDKDATISSIINTVNDSEAGVKLSFSNVSQSFTLESKATGDASEINVYQKKGNLLNAMFNIDSSQLAPTQADVSGMVTALGQRITNITLADGNDLENGSLTSGNFTIKMAVDGENYKNYELDLSALNDGNTHNEKEVSEKLSEAFKSAMGADFTDDLSVSYKDGKMSIISEKGASTIDIDVTDADTQKLISSVSNNSALYPADESYVVADGVSEMKFMLNGEEVTVTASNPTAGIMAKDLVDAGIIKMPTAGRFIAAGDVTFVDGADEQTDPAAVFMKKYFGKTSLTGAKDGEIITKRGANSILEISSDGNNFTKYSSATNLFTFDGTTINVTEAKDFVAASEDEYITVDTKKDNSAIKDVVVKFVDDYNKLIEDLYKVTSTSRPKSSGSYYDPLTEEQEEEMSDKEIEKWNENAKQGLLYHDNNIQKFLSEIRSAMLTRVDGFGLADLGISTKDWRDNGKLEIDESKLDTAIEAYGDKVANLFTSTNGLASKLESVVDKAVSTSKTSTNKTYGYLSQLAGIEGTKTDKDNSIYKQMEAINKTLERLNTKYENEQERYWKQYTRLETLMAQMQSTMSYFEQ